jgi:hypothetical protein
MTILKIFSVEHMNRYYTYFITSTLLTLSLIFSPFAGKAQLSITSTGTPFTIDFDATIAGVNNSQFAGLGFASNPGVGQLDSEAFGVTGTTFLARGQSSGAVTDGGIYAFTVATGDNALGFQPSTSEMTPGDIVLKIINNTGGSVNSITLSYLIWQYNDQERSTAINFYHSLDSSNWTIEPTLSFVSDEGSVLIIPPPPPQAAWEDSFYSIILDLSASPLADGSSYFIRWNTNDFGGSGSRDQLAIDDISVTMGSMSFDSDSEALSFGSQPGPLNIESTDDTESEAKSVFWFQLSDIGTFDGAPTKVQSIRITPGTSNNVSWSSQIQGVRLDDFSSNFYNLESVTISDAEIDILVSENEITILDGGDLFFRFWIYFNTSGIIDGGSLDFKIDSDAQGFSTYSGGSDFATSFPADIISTTHTIDVLATELRFINQPVNANTFEAMATDVSVEATDINGNRDLDFINNILLSSSGSMTGDPIAVTAVDGLATWLESTSPIIHTVSSTGLTLSTSSGALASTPSDPFDIIQTADRLKFTSYPILGQRDQVVDPIVVSALKPDLAVDDTFTGEVTLAVSSGPGGISGTLMKAAVDGVATFDDIIFDTDGIFTLSASGPAYMDEVTSGDIEIVPFFQGFFNCPAPGWQPVLISGNAWLCANDYISVSGVGGSSPTEAWYVSPAIDFSTLSSQVMRFDSWTSGTDISYPRLEVVYSTDYPGTGNPNIYTWETLTFNLPVENSAVWTPSGIIDLSGIASTARIAFKYTSSGTAAGTATDWRIDNVAITESGCSAPTTQASNLTFSNIASTSMTLNWDSGNGTGRIVLAKEGSAVDQVPVDLTSYSADPDFTVGQDIGGGNIVVYLGNASSVDVTGLSEDTEYHFAVFEYNCDAVTPVFNTTAPAIGNQFTTDPDASDIVVDAGFVYPENIAYGSYQAPALTIDPGNSLAVFGLTLRDGGASGNSDLFPTTLTSISFNANGSTAIKAAGLYYSGAFIATVNSNGSLNDFTFDISGTPIIATDVSTADFQLYVTFMNGSDIIDNEQIVFTVTSAIADPAGTLFTLPDAGGATSIQAPSGTGNENVIRVNSTTLSFVQVPTSTIIVNSPFSIEVEAVDASGTRDLDKTLDISVIAGTGSLISGSGLQRNTSTGAAIWDDLTYDTEENGIRFQVADNPLVLTPITTNLLNAKSGLSVYTFTGAAGDEPDFAPDSQPVNLTIGNISRGSDLVAQTFSDAFNARSWSQTSLPEDNYFYEFTITADAGYDFTISSIELDHRRSATGPPLWVVRSSVDNYTANIGGFFSTPAESVWFTNEEIPFGANVQDQSSVTIRLYAYNANSALGTWTIDNLYIFGTVVDDQAPSFTEGFPQSDSASIDGFHLLANVDEPVVASYLIKNNGASAPATPDDVVNGEGGIQHGNIVVAEAGTNYKAEITGLTLASGYDVYWVLDDGTNPTIINASQINVRTSDNLAEVNAPGTQVAAATLASTADTPAEAVDVFAFTIIDNSPAPGGDGAPANVSKIWIRNAGSTADWETALSGLSLLGSSLGAIPVEDVRIYSDSIVIDIDPVNLVIPDQGSEEITMAVYLASTGLTDGSTLQFEIDDVPGEEFSTATHGSQFASPFVSSAITSNEHTIEVTADRLFFSSFPTSVASATTKFSVQVQAVDENGNLDTDNSSTIILSRGLGTGTLSSPSSSPAPPQTDMINGEADWNDLSYDVTNEFFTIVAHDNDLVLLSDVTNAIEAGDADDLVVDGTTAISADLSVNNVDIQNGGQLSIDPGVTLFVSGDFNIDGTLVGTSGTVNFNDVGDGLQQITGTASVADFYNITVSNDGAGVRAEININLHNTLSMQPGANMDLDGDQDNRVFTLISTPTYTARIGAIGDGATINGEVTWQRSLRTGPAGFRYIGTPIKGQTLDNIRDDVWIQGVAESYPDAYTNIATFSEPLGTNGQNGYEGWQDFTSYANPLEVGKGMKLWLWSQDYETEQVIQNSGAPTIGSGDDGTAVSGEAITFNASFTPTAYDGGGWNFFANPYPCELDWDLVKINGDINGKAVHVWNPTMRNYGTYHPETGQSTNGGTRYIASGQGFFVKADAAGASVEISEDSKVDADGNSFLRRADGPMAKLMVGIETSTGIRDEAAIAFTEFASDGYDPTYDADKFSAGWINISSLVDEQVVTINAMGPKRGVQMVKLNIEPYVFGACTLSFYEMEDFEEGAQVHLLDHYLGRSTVISNGANYPFSIDEDVVETYGDRFEIQFVEQVGLRLQAEDVRAGREIVVPVIADKLADVLSAGMSISWDSDALTFVGVEDAGIGDMADFDLAEVEEGRLGYYHEEASAMELTDGTQLFSMRFRALNGVRQAAIRFDGPQTELVAINDIAMPFTTENTTINILQNSLVSGGVLTSTGAIVNEVIIQAENDDEVLRDQSNASGNYTLETLEQSTYAISGQKADDAPLTESLTTLDIIHARQHILGQQQFESPYQWIAADVNGSGSVTAFDLVEMRKVILGLYTVFPSGLNWLIIPDVFDLQQDPFAYSTTTEIALGTEDEDLDFVAVKVGDVDHSWTNQEGGRLSGGSLDLLLAEISLDQDLVEIPVIVDESVSLRGYQFSMVWNPTELEYVGVSSKGVDGHFNDQLAVDGILTTLWDESGGSALNLEAGQELFTVKFRARHEQADTEVQINSALTKAMAFGSDFKAFSIRSKPLRVSMEALRNGNLEVFQNVPNPFDFSTQIDFRIPKSGLVRLTVVNSVGKIVYMYEDQYEPGLHSISWDRSQSALPVTEGLYLYRLECNGEEVVKKMLVR